MYGDTSVIRGLAHSMRDRAADIRAQADRLVGQADHTHWTGLAADAMRARARDRAGALRGTAGLHEDAAQALDRHADAVDRLKELIAAIERRVGQLIDAARDRLAGLAHTLSQVLPDPVDELLDHLEPPPHGSVTWLDLDVPGLSR